MLETFRESFPGLTQLLTALAYLFGMIAGTQAVLLFRRRQHDHSITSAAIITSFLTCATFLYLPTAIDAGQETFFGSPTILSYSAGSAVSKEGQVVLDTVLQFVQLVGLWAFIWGFALLKRAHARVFEPALNGKAVTHIIGGIFCLNIVASLQLLAETFGLEQLLSYIIVPG
jgi:hypothetical protein